jgi:hypothetical protein
MEALSSQLSGERPCLAVKAFAHVRIAAYLR